MTRYTTPGKLPAASAVPSFCPRARLHVRNVRAPPRRSLFFDLLRVECYTILLMKSDNIARRMRAKPLDHSAGRMRGDYRIHSMIKKVADGTDVTQVKCGNIAQISRELKPHAKNRHYWLIS